MWRKIKTLLSVKEVGDFHDPILCESHNVRILPQLTGAGALVSPLWAFGDGPLVSVLNVRPHREVSPDRDKLVRKPILDPLRLPPSSSRTPRDAVQRRGEALVGDPAP